MYASGFRLLQFSKIYLTEFTEDSSQLCFFFDKDFFLQPFSILSTVYVLYIHGFFFISSISFLRIPWSLIITMWGALPLVLIDATRRTSQLVCRDHQRSLLFANACNFAGCIDK